MVGIFVALLTIAGITTVSSRNSGLSLTSQCICPGYNATYECSISGIGRTIWTGTGFRNCPSNVDSIILRHNQFSSSGGATGTCNSGTIVGHSIGVQDADCYISQLDVFVTSDIVGTTIVCSHDNGSAEFMEVGRSTLTTTTDPLPPPSNVMLTSVNRTQLTFSWDPPDNASDCLAVKYNILTENCGSCPVESNTTTVDCTNPQPQPNPGTTCAFTVQTEVCDGVVGGASDTHVARLRVPDIPVITVIPTYSQSEKTLTSISVRITESANPFFISNGINGTTTSYNITFTNSTSGDFCGSGVVSVSACTNGVCNRTFDVLSSLCTATGLSVTVLATNILGDSEASPEVLVDQTNNFVDLNYNMNTKSLICAFRNLEDASKKSCRIEYRVCEQQEVRTIQENSTSNQIILELDDLQEATYCYVATISNSTITINVNGMIDLSDSTSQANTGAIVGGVIGGLCFLVFIGVILLLSVILYKKFKPHPTVDPVRYVSNYTDQGQTTQAGTEPKLLPVKKSRFELLEVDTDCELAEFIQAKQLIFQRGAVFYEFKRPKEDINPDKEVIIMKKDTQTFYTGKEACKMIGAPGKEIRTPNLQGYAVFVQSMGIGRRPLEAGSRILYDREVNPSQTSRTLELEPVDDNRFIQIEVDSEGGPLRQLIERKNLQFKPGCAFFEFMNKQEDIDETKEVILMEKKTGKMFTGPAAHYTIGAPGRDIDKPSLPDKRVFVQSLYKGRRFIHGNTLLLYQDPGTDVDAKLETLDTVKQGRFKIYHVKEHSGLRAFVEEKCHLPYVARRFFFEFFSDEEDISKDKEIILMNRETAEYLTGIKAKTMIGAPGEPVQKPTETLKKYRVFIQNGGAGTQYLMAGTSVLYQVTYKF